MNSSYHYRNCPIALLPYCPIALLPYFPIALLRVSRFRIYRCNAIAVPEKNKFLINLFYSIKRLRSRTINSIFCFVHYRTKWIYIFIYTKDFYYNIIMFYFSIPIPGWRNTCFLLCRVAYRSSDVRQLSEFRKV